MAARRDSGQASPNAAVSSFTAFTLLDFLVICRPVAAGCTSSLLYLSLTGCRAASHTGRLWPHGATIVVIHSAPHRGSPGVGTQMQSIAFGNPRRGYSVWDRSSPPEANEFLGFAGRNPWTALLRILAGLSVYRSATVEPAAFSTTIRSSASSCSNRRRALRSNDRRGWLSGVFRCDPL